MLGKYMKNLLISIVVLATIIAPFIGTFWGLYLYLEQNKPYGAIIAIALFCLSIHDFIFYVNSDFI